MIYIIKMSRAEFELFNRHCKKDVGDQCKHPRVYGGTCDVCFEILYYEREHENNYHHRASYSYVSKHNRVSHFTKALLKSEQWYKEYELVSDFEEFLWGWDRIDKGGRKNFLLNGWLLWKLSERRGIECEKYKIKNVKSEKDHERLWKLVSEKLEW